MRSLGKWFSLAAIVGSISTIVACSGPDEQVNSLNQDEKKFGWQLLFDGETLNSNCHLNTEIGTGAIDFVQILKKSKVGGVEYLIMEQENFKIDPYVSIQQSAKYMRSTLLK